MDVGESLLNRYELIEEMGRGSSTVFRAFDRRVRREVAVKELRFAGGESEREVRALAALNHPNIVTLHDVVDDGRRTYLVMELVRGRTLEEIVSHGPLKAEIAARIALDICKALEAAHRTGVVHLDIKPTNIIISTSGLVKVADFGIAALFGDSGGGRATPAYASPEQLSGSEVDERSDIFSLGVVIYQMLTGTSPFEAPTAKGSAKKVLGLSPTPVCSVHRVPEELSDIVMKALAKSPDERFRSARELRQSLEPFAEESSLEDFVSSKPLKASLFRQLTDVLSSRPQLVERVGVALVAASSAFFLTTGSFATSAAIGAGLLAAVAPFAALMAIAVGALIKISAFSMGLALIAAPLLISYAWFGRRNPAAAIAPASAPVLFAAGLSPTFPLVTGVFFSPLIAAAMGAAGGFIDALLFLFSSELAGLESVSNPLIVGISLARSFERAPGLLLQPILWSAVAGGFALLRRYVPVWSAMSMAFLAEGAGYYWVAGRYAGLPVEVIMRRLAFSLIIIIVLALFSQPGHGRIDASEPD